MNKIEGVEKYFNTQNEHFNSNAYAWYSFLKNNELFSNIELPFQILLEYLYFLENYKTPISCVKRLNQKMTENNLTKKQKIFIYDKLSGLIANDYDNRDDLISINLEILDFRLELEPYENLDIENYSIDGIRKKASMINDLYERLKFLKHRKLKYEIETDEIGEDIGLGQEIEIEIEIIEKQIKENMTKRTSTEPVAIYGYMIALVLIIAALYIPFSTLPTLKLILFSAVVILLIVIVGNFQLRNDDQLSEKNFMEISLLILKKVPPLNWFGKKEATDKK